MRIYKILPLNSYHKKRTINHCSKESKNIQDKPVFSYKEVVSLWYSNKHYTRRRTSEIVMNPFPHCMHLGVQEHVCDPKGQTEKQMISSVVSLCNAYCSRKICQDQL